MGDIDRLSRRVPVLCKVAPSVADVHLEDVHRAGGVMAILGELDRAGLIDTVRRHRAQRHAGRGARTLGRARAPAAPRVRDVLSRGAGRRADHRRLQPGTPLRRA